LPIISIKAGLSGLLGAKRKNNTAKLNPITNNTLPGVRHHLNYVLVIISIIKTIYLV
jgi:hypothetical protein